MKTEEEIKEEMERLKKRRDSFVVTTCDWNMLEYAIRELEWVLEK